MSAKRQFNIYIEQEYTDIITAYGLYLEAKGKIKTANKTEAFREAMKHIRLAYPLNEIIASLEKTRTTAGETE